MPQFSDELNGQLQYGAHMIIGVFDIIINYIQEKQIRLNMVEEVERLVEFLKGHLVAFRR